MAATTRLFTLPTSPMKPNVLQPSFKSNSADAVVSTTNPDGGGGGNAALKPLVVTAADSTAGNENRKVFASVVNDSLVQYDPLIKSLLIKLIRLYSQYIFKPQYVP